MSIVDYFFPPVCLGCGVRRLPGAEGVLCATCVARWEEETSRTCRRCGRRMAHCVCQPLNGTIPRRYPVFTLGAYRSGTVVERLVLAGKRLQSRKLFDFLADALAARLRQANVCGGAHTVIAYVPRNLWHKRLEGQDQGRLLAEALGRCISSEVIHGFVNRGILSQKRLHQSEDRLLRAARVYRPRHNVLTAVTGKTVILLDDVCTAGGSLYACQSLLRQAGAARVICAVVGKTGC